MVGSQSIGGATPPPPPHPLRVLSSVCAAVWLRVVVPVISPTSKVHVFLFSSHFPARYTEVSDCGNYVILYVNRGADPKNLLYYCDLRELPDGGDIKGAVQYSANVWGCTLNFV